MWILIPIIPRNIFKLLAKIFLLNMTKIASVKKILPKIILTKRTLNDMRFLCYSKKHDLICPDLYRLILSGFI